MSTITPTRTVYDGVDEIKDQVRQLAYEIARPYDFIARLVFDLEEPSEETLEGAWNDGAGSAEDAAEVEFWSITNPYKLEEQPELHEAFERGSQAAQNAAEVEIHGIDNPYTPRPRRA